MTSAWQSIVTREEFAYEGTPFSRPGGIWERTMWHASWFVVEGEARASCGTRCWRAGAGTGLILPARWRRLQSFAAGTRIVSLALSITWPDASNAVEFAEPIAVHPDAASRLMARVRTLISLKTAPEDGVPAALVEFRRRATLQAYALEWMEVVLGQSSTVLRPPGVMDARLTKLNDLLARQPRLGAIDWLTLKRALGLSRTQLDRLCWKAWGISVCGLRDRIVLDRARELLAGQLLNLAGIAREIGASDASHFVKWYRRCTGQTPGRERQLMGSSS